MDLKQSFVDIINCACSNNVAPSQIRDDFEAALVEIFSNLNVSDALNCGGRGVREEVNEKVEKIQKGCKYVFQKGKKSGQICGTGKKDYCCKHRLKSDGAAAVNTEETVTEPQTIESEKIVKIVKKIKKFLNKNEIKFSLKKQTDHAL